MQQRTSIIILSCNTLEITRKCIESIRRFTASGTYEIIVIDNASADGSAEWLRTEQGIKCLFNQENEGFPKGCNQGMAEAGRDNDILLLNSDVVVTPRWLEQLKTALYSAEDVGAVSLVTNRCSNRQQIQTEYTSLDKMQEFAESYNHTDPRRWTECFRLVGFCLLIKRKVADMIGGLDERFTPGNYEDDDYSLRIREAGYRLLLCRDTFIHHFGSASFKKYLSAESLKGKSEQFMALLKRNEQLFCQKWQLSPKYRAVETLAAGELPKKLPEKARILHIGCGCGATLFLIKERLSAAKITGIAYDRQEAMIAGWSFEASFCGNIEAEIFSLLSGQYDWIIISQLQEKVKNINEFLKALFQYVSPGGAMYCWLNDKPVAVTKE